MHKQEDKNEAMHTQSHQNADKEYAAPGSVLLFMQKVKERGSIPGLERISALLSLLGDPQKDLKYVHVAGTNGKVRSAPSSLPSWPPPAFPAGSFPPPGSRDIQSRSGSALRGEQGRSAGRISPPLRKRSEMPPFPWKRRAPAFPRSSSFLRRRPFYISGEGSAISLSWKPAWGDGWIPPMSFPARRRPC